MSSFSGGGSGTPGQGVPTGGTANQVLAKIDGTNYNTQWVAPSGGGGLTAPQMPFFYISGVFGSNVALTGVQSPVTGTASNGQVVLVANNSTPSQNGLYVVNTGGAWSRDASYTQALIPVAKVILDVLGGAYEEYLADPPASFVLGTSALPYSNPYSSSMVGGSSIRVRGGGASGSASVDFHTAADGAYPTGTPDFQIIRLAGSAGGLQMWQAGGGDVFLIGTSSLQKFKIQSMAFQPESGICFPTNRITGGTSLSVGPSDLHLLFDGITIAAYTITLQGSGSIPDGKILTISSTNQSSPAVTALTITPGSATTIDGAITTLAANGFAQYKYIASITKWIRVG